jgi:hypothetical protein
VGFDVNGTRGGCHKKVRPGLLPLALTSLYRSNHMTARRVTGGNTVFVFGRNDVKVIVVVVGRRDVIVTGKRPCSWFVLVFGKKTGFGNGKLP